MKSSTEQRRRMSGARKTAFRKRNRNLIAIKREKPGRRHSKAKGSAAVALLLIDVINDFAFPEAKNLLRYAFPAAQKIAALKTWLAAQGTPVIYVNDNFGRWRSDFEAQVEHCLEANAAGRSITELLRPGPEDYFVLKPKHSGFYSTTLDVLLHHLGVKKIILAGFAADICVLYTANDAYMRGLEILVPSDCVASETLQAKKHALDQMERFLKAQVLPSAGVRLSDSYRQANTDKGYPTPCIRIL